MTAPRFPDAAANLPPPTFRFRVWPCEYCGACWCPCVTDPVSVRRAQAEVASRHEQSVTRAKRHDNTRRVA